MFAPGALLLDNPPVRRDAPDGNTRVHCHSKDRVLCFLEDVTDLSVFFYRHDGSGEGGSDVWWLGEVLFNAVLTRLLPGGLIVTDGSNCGYYEGSDRGASTYLPWNAMSGSEPFRRPCRGTQFTYAGWRFKCVSGPLRDFLGRRNTFVWQGVPSRD